MKNRPKGFGKQALPSFTPGAHPRPSGDESRARSGVMPAEDVGPIVVSAVKGNRLHVLTHLESRRAIEARFGALLEDYDFAAKELAEG